jgi:hypothetical protein
VLIMRLPTVYLRAVAIIILLGVNTTNAMLRLIVGTQPPHPRMFADAASVRDSGGKTRVVLCSLDPKQHAVRLWLHASNYGIFGDAGRYYACMALGITPTPSEFRSGEMNNAYHDLIGELVSPQDIPSIAADRLIIWERYSERFDEPEKLSPDDDAIARALEQHWRLVRPPEIFRLRSWYDWSNMGWSRRREYERAPGAPSSEARRDGRAG